jgi:hypothetical protein
MPDQINLADIIGTVGVQEIQDASLSASIRSVIPDGKREATSSRELRLR